MSGIPYDLTQGGKDNRGQTLGRLAKFVNETATGKANNFAGPKEGSLATALVPLNGGKQEINVVQDYPWTLSKTKEASEHEEVPFVRLREYKCVDSSIKKQLGFYYQLIKDTAANAAPGTSSSFSREVSMDVYTDIWPKDNPTGFSYIFPYFQKNGFEIQTEAWASLGSMGDAIKGLANAVAGSKSSMLSDKFKKGAGKVATAIEIAGGVADASMNISYPSVGITDRPKMFQNHNDRTITINFILYNTQDEGDWMQNRDLVYLLMSQNLFNKRDLTTGVPPVFYDVHIPGQYFSYASSITNLKIDYLGNQRLLYGGFIVPDAYDITITLSELVKPSKNQFEAIQSGAAIDYVNVNQRNIVSKGLDMATGITETISVGLAAIAGDFDRDPDAQAARQAASNTPPSSTPPGN